MVYRNRYSLRYVLPLLCVVLSGSDRVSQLIAADFQEAESLFFSGEYAACEQIAAGEVDRGVWNERWPLLLMRCQLVAGRYEMAARSFEEAAGRFKNSIGLRMLGSEVYRFAGEPQLARQQYEEIVELVRREPWRYSSAADRVTLGRFFLSQREDAREVLELFFDRARKSSPQMPEIYEATAQLALDKHDYQEAATSIAKAIELQPANPDYHYLAAMAWETSDPEKSAAALSKALELNPRHVPSLLHQVDQLIDAEQYTLAGEMLTQVFEVNHRQPEAWAYHAVIAHLLGRTTGEQELRAAALSSWHENYNVDHLIGNKLSRKYRFAEGVEYQRRALQFDPSFLAAKFQLSQDLLRLGGNATESLGWALANEVHNADGYNVVAYNLVTLKSELEKFTTLETDQFHVRMESREARIYGQAVLELLTEAHTFLCDKYQVELDGPVTVEIFPRQQDFAIRTFGLPGGAGFLGVCFGRVITANSPSSQGESPANWQSVLWHEFCHVVTLEKTRNKMPRWLSEGISVYEEQQRSASWGERLTPEYRQMIARNELTPVSELSSAFLRPKSPAHLQFAYYESSLVVRYLIEQHGLEVLLRVLDDLAVGMPINDALARYVGSLGQLDYDFAQYALKHVAELAPKVDFEVNEQLMAAKLDEVRQWVSSHPNHYQGVLQFAAASIKAGELDEAKLALLQLRDLCRGDASSRSVLGLLARIYREQKQTERELEVLSELAKLSDRNLEVYSRLAELQEPAEEWESIRDNAYRFLAVQPMLPRGHEMLASAAKPLDDHRGLAKALGATLEMNPVDPAGLHYEVAVALHAAEDNQRAKRHVLLALEHAPRYRDAQQLLLQLVDPPPPQDASP